MSQKVDFIGNITLPDGDILPVNKITDFSFVPPRVLGHSIWTNQNMRQTAFCVRFEHDAFPDEVIVEKMRQFVFKEFETNPKLRTSPRHD